MQVKDYSFKVLRFQQTTDASLFFSKRLHWMIVIMVILQSILYTYWTGRDQINIILGEVLYSKGFIIPAHVVCTRSIECFIHSDQAAIYQVACSAPLYKFAYCAIYFRMYNFIVLELATV